MADEAGEITVLLQNVRANRPGARDQLVSRVYRELHRIACSRIGPSDRRLADPTTLVSETYLRLFKDEERSWENRHHFFFVAARVMRDILVERARRKNTQKRGGKAAHIELREDSVSADCEAVEFLALHDAIDALEDAHPTAANVIMLRFFAGLNRAQTAELLQISEGAVWREWMFARAWLLSRIGASDPFQGDSSAERKS